MTARPDPARAREASVNFEPVRTLADLESLDADEILAGYLDAKRGDPEPGPNRGRAYWHGWRNRMMDLGELPHDDASRQLARELWPGGVFVGRLRAPT
jgi:hypothetical protein